MLRVSEEHVNFGSEAERNKTCRCRRCRRRLGRYDVWEQADGSIGLLEPASEERIVAPGRHLTGDERALIATRFGVTGVKGPRVGSGIYAERFEDRFYFRIRCKCGRNEKVRGFSPEDRNGELYI